MRMQATEKIIEALSQLMEGFSDLHQALEAEFGEGTEEDFEEDMVAELNPEVDAAMVSELRTALESVIDTDDFAPEEIATLISSLSDALEEIDPEVFESEEEEEIVAVDDYEDEEDEDYDDELLDDEDDYYDDEE